MELTSKRTNHTCRPANCCCDISIWKFSAFLCAADPSTSNPPLRRNALKNMMCAQAEKVSVVLPNKVRVRNKKDELFNDILQLIEKEGIVWKASEVDNGTAANAICTL